MTTIDLNIKGDIEVLRLQPGDVIVVSLRSTIPPSTFNLISERMTARFPNHEVMILADGIDLSIRREEVLA